MERHDTPRSEVAPHVNIGPTEIIVVLIIALLVFGPKRLPQMGKSLGKGVREFKKAAETAKTELGLGEVTDQINEVKSTFTEPLQEVKGTIGDLKSSVDVKSAIEAPVKAEDAAAAGVVTVDAAAGAPDPAAAAGEVPAEPQAPGPAQGTGPDAIPYEPPTAVEPPAASEPPPAAEAPAASEAPGDAGPEAPEAPEAPGSPQAPDGAVTAGAGTTPTGA